MFDPSIILGAKQYTGPDPNETMRTLGQLALMHTQQQQGEASLADLLNQRQQAQAIRGVYAANPDDPAARVRGLYAAGAGDQARQEQDQSAQQQKMLTDLIQHVRQRVTNTLYGTKDQADYEARLARMDPRERAMFSPPATWDEAKPMVEALAIPPEKRAELDATKEWHDKLLGAKTFKDGTGQGLQFNPETETFDKKLGQPKPQKAAGGGLGGEDGTGLTKDSIEMGAQDLYRTGKITPGLLPIGKSGTAARMAIVNRATEIAKEQGGDMSSNRGSYAADTASLKKLQPTADALESFENTGLKNLDLAVAAFKKLPDGGSSLLNQPLRSAAEKLGSADMAAAKTALLTVQTEFAKILGGGTSSVVTEGARHEAQDLLRGDYTLSQFLAAADMLKKDAGNRSTEVHRQIRDIQKRLGFGRSAGTPAASESSGGAAPAGATVTVRRKADGKTKTLSPEDAAQVLADPAYERVP